MLYQQTLEYLTELDHESYIDVKNFKCSVLISLALNCDALSLYDHMAVYCTSCLEIEPLQDRAYSIRGLAHYKQGNL